MPGYPISNMVGKKRRQEWGDKNEEGSRQSDG
jgi:hypothetical protein